MLDFLIDALATWRLTSLFHREDGPFAIFDHIRNGINVQYNQHNQPYGDNEVAKAFSCMWCLSVWVGFGIRHLAHWLRYSMALSAVGILIERFLNEK